MWINSQIPRDKPERQLSGRKEKVHTGVKDGGLIFFFFFFSYQFLVPLVVLLNKHEDSFKVLKDLRCR